MIDRSHCYKQHTDTFPRHELNSSIKHYYKIGKLALIWDTNLYKVRLWDFLWQFLILEFLQQALSFLVLAAAFLQVYELLRLWFCQVMLDVWDVAHNEETAVLQPVVLRSLIHSGLYFTLRH